MNEHGVRSKFSKRISILAPEGESRTQQHFLERVNINNILAKYRKTGILEHVKRATAKYGDFTELANYASNMDKVAKAQQAFESLPAELRNQFKNSIPGFFEYMKNPENKGQLQKWGFLKPDEPEVPPGSNADGSIKPLKKSSPVSDKEE